MKQGADRTFLLRYVRRGDGQLQCRFLYVFIFTVFIRSVSVTVYTNLFRCLEAGRISESYQILAVWLARTTEDGVEKHSQQMKEYSNRAICNWKNTYIARIRANWHRNQNTSV